MARCAGVKRNGEPCTLPANGSNGYCWAHDPANAEQRRRAASRGGRSRPGRLSKDLHELLEDLTSRVVDGELPSGRGAVAAQLINVRLRLLEYERKIREEAEILKRIEALEKVYGTGRRWG